MTVELPKYGKLDFKELGRDVNEARMGCRDDFDFGDTYPGHCTVGGMNFNSLNRIASKYADNSSTRLATLEAALRYCQQMFRLDLSKMVDWDGPDFNQAVFDTMKRVEAALASQPDAPLDAADHIADAGEMMDAAEECARPDEIAAAWKAWRARHGGKLGPGPAFVEAINAAFAIRLGKRMA